MPRCGGHGQMGETELEIHMLKLSAMKPMF